MDAGELQGWHADPFGLHEMRYFSAGRPTELVRDGRVEAYDEPPTQGAAVTATPADAAVAPADAAATPADATVGSPQEPSAGSPAGSDPGGAAGGYPGGPQSPPGFYPSGPQGPLAFYPGGPPRLPGFVPGGPPGPAGFYPGYPPVGPRPGMSHRLDGLATALAVMLYISAVISLIGVLFGPASIIVLLLSLPIQVVFLIWFYRARKNAGHLDWPQRWSPGWSIFGWFVPICLLWFPYQIMADIWRAGQSAPQRAKFPFLPAAWWACWCLAWFTGFKHTTLIGFGPNTSVGSGGTTVTHGQAYALYFGGTRLSLVFVAIAACLLAVIVRQVSAGPVGRVGSVLVPVPWQPGAPAVGSDPT